MDEREYFQRLESTAETPSDLFEHFETRTHAGWTYHALPSAHHDIERGTVIIPDADVVVRGYPSVPRVLVLDPGIESVFGEEAVAVEEKLDGFNVRIADLPGEASESLAFTRGGYVCPYTTGRARDRLDLSAFFADHPEKALCAELVGPETPYTSHDYDDVDSHEFRVFDVRDRASGDPLSVERRRDLCARYGFEQPRLFGRYEPSDAVEAVRKRIDRLDDAEREGVVLKSTDGTAMVKYTTESQHHAELAYAFSLPFDYGRDFVFSRVVREAFQAAEFDDSSERLRERAHSLGESILLPMVETIDDVSAGEAVGERQTVRGPSDEVDALFDHLREQSLTLDVESDRRENGERVVEFLKVSEATHDRIQYYLGGGTRDE
ncbi:RNA ligase [Salinigranum rubrum]|uniref:RNA ligase n=1 Tax=Salinigranum rubrum TaxID=755307 RepID=A0A2I8VII2_9EURY|nr:RNA ligase [Salinigranum rubrum]AUV80869.1 RNA ligase [Salinigranum rubrum]